MDEHERINLRLLEIKLNGLKNSIKDLTYQEKDNLLTKLFRKYKKNKQKIDLFFICGDKEMCNICMLKDRHRVNNLY